MANSGFSGITIINKEHTITVGKKYITREGYIYRKIQDLINNRNYSKLISYGIEVSNN